MVSHLMVRYCMFRRKKKKNKKKTSSSCFAASKLRKSKLLLPPLQTCATPASYPRLVGEGRACLDPPAWCKPNLRPNAEPKPPQPASAARQINSRSFGFCRCLSHDPSGRTACEQRRFCVPCDVSGCTPWHSPTWGSSLTHHISRGVLSTLWGPTPRT